MKENTPHDDLFKVTFSISSEVEAFLKTYLPGWIALQLDYSTLKKEPDSFINENLKQYFSDIIYACQWKNSRKILHLSFLLEHKSYVPKNIYIQLLRYLTEAYDHQYKSNEALKLVLPIVVYHGEESWKKRSFSSHFNLPDDRFEKFLPQFEFELIDLNSISDDLIIRQSIGLYLRSTFLVFKHKNDKDFIEQFSQEIFIFVEQELNHTQKMSFLRSLLTYIFRAFRFEKEDFQAYAKKLPKMIETVAGNLYDRLIQEGIEKGMEKERIILHLEDKISLLSRLASKGFTNDAMADISGMDMAFVREFTAVFTGENAAKLLSGIANARHLPDFHSVEKHLVQQMNAYGFSLASLKIYFGKPENELNQLLN
jgi:predicted transposase/invertase (TIGR01784 family)